MSLAENGDPYSQKAGLAHPTQPDPGLVIQPLLSPKAPGLIRQLHTFRFSLTPVWAQVPVPTRILASALVPSGGWGETGAQASKSGERAVPPTDKTVHPRSH